jgi:transcriptional regulator with AAA-type ATPase domain
MPGMAYRLVVVLDGRTQRMPLAQGEQVIGSHAECLVQIAHPSVSRRHATIVVEGETVSVRDLGSRNGTRVRGRRIDTCVLEPGAQIQLGAVRAVLEQLPDDDLEAAVRLAAAAGEEQPPETPPDQSTWRAGVVESFTLERLPALLLRLEDGLTPSAYAQVLGEALFSGLPCEEVTVSSVAAGATAVVFTASRVSSPSASAQAVSFVNTDLEVNVVLPSAQLANVLRPLLGALAALLRVAGRPSPTAARSEQSPPTPPPLPDPPSVVPAVRQIYEVAARVAAGNISVLILGESGTGKEVLARYLHGASAGARGPFLALNCASLPRDLLESELFGIERGVATGVDARPGKFEQADGGTLFLDEIGDMAVETQAKILRVLQCGEVFRLGGREPRKVAVRIVAATNRDLHELLRGGGFRTDLYHRLAGWVAELPPLRQRRADVPNLAAFFLAHHAAERGVRVAGISRAAIAALTAYSWPGNVRELENEIARAVLFLEDGELLDTARLSEAVRAARDRADGSTLAAVLERVERDEIALALAAAGSVEAAAARLGMSRATLYRRIKELGISAS